MKVRILVPWSVLTNTFTGSQETQVSAITSRILLSGSG